MRKTALSAWFCFHLFALTVWLMPASAVQRALVPLVRPYIRSTGLWQEWAMFAPKPLTLNFHLDAEVTFPGGKVVRHQFPRMVELGIIDRYRKERYRKWSDYIRPDANSLLWPDVARYVARLYAAPGNRPLSVSLGRHWTEIPPPDPTDFQPIPRRYPHVHSYRFFQYRVRPEDLR